MDEINFFRLSPKKFKKKLGKILEEIDLDIIQTRFDKEKNQELIGIKDFIINAFQKINPKIINLPKLNYSDGLSGCARDLICEIGSLSIVAPVSIVRENDTYSLDRALCRRIINKYGKIGEKIHENFSYSVLNPIVVLCQILSENQISIYGLKDYLYDPELRVVGISYGQHSSLKHCVCIIYANNFKEVI